MVRITLLSGPYKGSIREYPDSSIAPEILRPFAEQEWGWDIEFPPEATEREVHDWDKADIDARIQSALLHGRSVWFMGVKYEVPSSEELETVSNALHEAMAHSSYEVGVDSDNVAGLWLGGFGADRSQL